MPTLMIGSTALHYREHGSGEMLLLIHSAGNTGAQWDALSDLLGEEFHLLAPDLYDCGGTGAWPRHRPMSFDDEAALLAGLLDRIQGRVHLVGHSFGGGVALRLAASHGERIRSLTLIEPAAYQVIREVGREDLWLEFLRVKNCFQAAALRGDHEAAWQPFFDYYCGQSGSWRSLPNPVRTAIMQKTQAQLNVYAAQETNPTRLADIKRLSCPTLAIHGALTTLPEAGLCAVIAANAARGRSAAVEGAGHMLPLTHAAVVAQLIREHVHGATADWR